MKNIKKSLAVAMAVGSLALGLAPSVAAYSALKSYNYDVNKFTGGNSNYHAHRYIEVPNWAKYSGSRRVVISEGWNFIRYQHVNFYGQYW